MEVEEPTSRLLYHENMPTGPEQEPGPDPSRSDPALTAVVHEAFLNFLLHSQPERVIRLPPHLFTGVVTYLMHWKSVGLYGLPSPPISDNDLLDSLSALVHRYMVRQRALHGQPEPSTGPAASGALGRDLLETALRASRASLLPEEEEEEPPIGGSSSEEDDDEDDDEDEEDEEEDEEEEEEVEGGAKEEEKISSKRPPRVSRREQQRLVMLRRRAGSIVDRLSDQDTARKAVFDFLEPQDLAAAQTACHRWRRMALPRAAEYFWNVLVCACWWATFPSVDAKHGCCMLEFLRREGTFSESVKNKGITTLPLGSAPRLPVSARLSNVVCSCDDVFTYLSGFVIAIDVADRMLDSLLASATIDLADAQARTQFFHQALLRDRTPELLVKNTGYLRGWGFKDAGCVERYLNSGHDAYRFEVMIIHKASGKVAMLLPADEGNWPQAGPGGMRYGIQWVGSQGDLTVGTYGTIPAGDRLNLSFEMYIRLEEEVEDEEEDEESGGGHHHAAVAGGGAHQPRLAMTVDTVAMHLHHPRQRLLQEEEEEEEEVNDDEEEEEEEAEGEAGSDAGLWSELARVMPHLLWH